MRSLFSRCIYGSRFYLPILLITALNACSDAASQAEKTILAPIDTEVTLVAVESLI